MRLRQWWPNAGFACSDAARVVTVDAATDVLLGDTMGEMFMYYAACDVVADGRQFSVVRRAQPD